MTDPSPSLLHSSAGNSNRWSMVYVKQHRMRQMHKDGQGAMKSSVRESAQTGGQDACGLWQLLWLMKLVSKNCCNGSLESGHMQIW